MEMQNNLKIFFCGISLFLVVHCAQGDESNPLECWHCSSSTHGAEGFCGETFDEDSLPDPEKMKESNINLLRNCSKMTNSEQEIAVCRKTVEEINGKMVTKRFCYYANKSDSLDHCMLESTETNVKRIFCQDCPTDRCNGGGRQFVTWLSQLLPLLLAKAVRF